MGLRCDSPRWVFKQVTERMLDADLACKDSCLRLAIFKPDVFWVQVDRPVCGQDALAVCWYLSVNTASSLYGMRLFEAWKASPANPHGDKTSIY